MHDNYLMKLIQFQECTNDSTNSPESFQHKMNN